MTDHPLGPERSLESDFDDAMHEIYLRALKEARYRATRFFQMLSEHRGLRTAQMLVNAATVSEGYTALWELGRLDLTVEAMILEHPRWHSLFTAAELEVCRRRLKEYHYIPNSAAPL